jgi:hypothetical protein
MFRNQYDTDVTVWSPEGRLLQVRAFVSLELELKLLELKETLDAVELTALVQRLWSLCILAGPLLTYLRIRCTHFHARTITHFTH